jgi:hypothetical protein
MDDPDVKLLVLIVLVAGLAGAVWYFRSNVPASVEVPVVTQPEASERAPAEDHPIHPVAALDPPASADRNLVPLPPLDDSDAYFLLALVDIFGPDVRDVLVKEALIDKFVTTVDNLPRSHVAEKIRPVSRLPDTFLADSAGNSSEYLLSADNYNRYDSLVYLIEIADLEFIDATYRRFYPLLQESYLRLGYPDGYFNDRVVEVIDHLLATPEPEGPIRLVRPHVLYEFADAELEALSSGQKLLLRMGGDHTARIKRVLSSLRTLITAG